MPLDVRKVLIVVAVVGIFAATLWATMGTSLQPADFTFANGTEVKSFDPAILTGQPEGRIMNCLFERLVNWHPETIEPIPGVAKSWGISDDGLTYTFHLRDDAKWSDGTPITAEDFHYSWRRFLGPRTAAEYAFLAWHIVNARNYSRGGSGISPGDPVEVELNLPIDAVNSRRGEILYGKLVRIENSDDAEHRIFVVDIDGEQIRFDPTDDSLAVDPAPNDTRWCRQVLFDFREVGIRVLDPLTLEVTLYHPAPFFIQLVGFYPFSPVNRQCVETYGNPGWTKSDKFVGNGPYIPLLRRIRDRIRMQRSETYWNRENVRINLVDALAVDSKNTALNMFMTDQIAWMDTVPPEALRILLKEDPPRNDLNPKPYMSSYFYMVNITRKPLNDVRVRRALSLAINREEICEKILAAGEVPAYSLVPPGMPGYERQTCDPSNIEEARRLLAEAGYPEGKGFPRMDILYNTDESHQTIAELIRSQWQRALGIQIKTRNEEWQSYNSSQRQMKYDLCRRAWIGDYVDPLTYLDMYVTDGEQNNTGFANERYDELIEASNSEADPEKRLAILEEAERMLMDELPIIPIYFYVSKNMVKPYVRGFYNNIQDFHPVSAMWIDHDHQGPTEFTRNRSVEEQP